MSPAIIRVRGNLDAEAAPRLSDDIRAAARRRDVTHIVVDFSDAGSLRMAGVAAISLAQRLVKRQGKTLELVSLGDQHRAALDAGTIIPVPPVVTEKPGVLERLGGRVLSARDSLAGFVHLVIDTGRQVIIVAVRAGRVPAGSVLRQMDVMGAGAVGAVGLLTFLVGVTMALQGAILMSRFGAGPFVADLIGISMIRELAPLLTAIILTGRTGAAIAAELGTMRVRSEIDALAVMGINPVRFLVVPRIAALSAVGPALTLLAIFIGIAGGMVVGVLYLDLSPMTFWDRIVERVELGDFVHGLIKSLVFAWIIGFSGCYLGMNASGDADSVGAATTRTVVVSIFSIIIVDALFATVSVVSRYG
jgi:phospholipid/cholesterol/gamma-HCH transport system permease protein